jgi:hypothetical protein
MSSSIGLNSTKVQVLSNEIGGNEWYNDDDNGDIMDTYSDNDNYDSNNDDFQSISNNSTTPIPQKRFSSNTPKSALKDPAAIRNDKFKNSLTLMDPHEVTGGSRQVRKAKTFKIPNIKNNSNYNKNGKNNKMNSIEVYSKLINGNIPLTGLAHIHFNDIVKLQKKQARILNMKVMRNNKNNHQNIVDEVFLYKEVREGDEVVDEHINNDIGDDDVGGFWDNGGDDDGDYYDNNDNQINDVNNNEEEGTTNVIESALSISMLDEENLAKRVEIALNSGFEKDKLQSNSYDTLCRKHIENFMKGAEDYARYHY